MTNILTEECDANDITAVDLSNEIAQAKETGVTVETYRLTEIDDGGYRKTVTGSMLWFPEIGHAGIEWGADADWTDAASPEEAVQLWQSGELRY